ncbi:MAG TPA: hypothetical protein DCR44_04520 [Acholeplasmatales bacterium]|nr:hypothetical protein [Acholeplasmatales bacterium]
MLNVSFLKKEIKESVKTSRILILLALFVFFAIVSSLTARYMNELLSLMSTDIIITFPEPTLTDAWMQFFKNTSSLCLIVYLIMMTGTVAQEKAKGSIMLVLTKRVSRFNFLFSKFVGGVVIFSVCYAASILVSGLYTQILFSGFAYDGLGMSLLLFWMMGVFFTAVAVFASVISKTPTTAALLGFAAYALFSILNTIRGFSQYNPAGASALVNEILQGGSTTSSQLICLAVTAVAAILMFSAGYGVFKKQEI